MYRNGSKGGWRCAVKSVEDWQRRYALDPSRHHRRMRAWRERHPAREKANQVYASTRIRLGADGLLALIEAHGNRCAICDESGADERGLTTLCVDHDHATGEVRGLLCRSCNSAIGFLADDIGLLESAIAYLGGRVR